MNVSHSAAAILSYHKGSDRLYAQVAVHMPNVFSAKFFLLLGPNKKMLPSVSYNFEHTKIAQ